MIWLAWCFNVLIFLHHFIIFTLKILQSLYYLSTINFTFNLHSFLHLFQKFYHSYLVQIFLYLLSQRDSYDFQSFPTILQCLLSLDSSGEVIDEAIRCLILKLGGKEDNSNRLHTMFQLLLKANTASALVTDPQGRYLLHYACRHLGNITCAVNIIKMLLIAHKEATMGLDSDECYAITTAGNKYLLLSTLLLFFSSSLLLFFSSSLLLFFSPHSHFLNHSYTFLLPLFYLSEPFLV